MVRHASLALLLAACAADPPRPPLAETGRPIETLGAPSLLSLADALDLAPPQPRVLRLLHGPDSCRPKNGVNPYVHLPPGRPRAGEPLAIDFVTRCGNLPPPPSAECWLIWSTRPIDRPIDFSPYGMSGCWLLVQPDNVLLVPPPRPGAMVCREGGVVRFRWASPVLGTRLWMQLLVSAPGENVAGFLSSPAVEVWVGS